MKSSIINDKEDCSNILYITYDGLLDPLGGSQILPYLHEIKREDTRVHILSFEKIYRSKTDINRMYLDLKNKNILWTHLKFTSRLGSIGKIYDMIKMYSAGILISIISNINIIHARGHTCADVASFIKKILRIQFIFDFRGFWVDEREEKGGGNRMKKLDNFIFKIYKKKEYDLINHCDQLVILTEAMIPEIINIGINNIDKITVIPCCADYSHFRLINTEQRKLNRKTIGLDGEDLVIGYLGSVGKMYRADLFIKLFELSTEKYPNIRALIITQNTNEFERLVLASSNHNIYKKMKIISGSRDNVPILLSSIDILIALSNPTFAKKSMSPTKIGEALACGIPVITNEGIGDVKSLINKTKSGLVLPDLSENSIKQARDSLYDLKKSDPAFIREESMKFLGLEKGHLLYKKVYDRIINSKDNINQF